MADRTPFFRRLHENALAAHRSRLLQLYRVPSLPPPDPRETAPAFILNHTSAYPASMTIEDAGRLRGLFDAELDAIAVTGGNCRVAQVRHAR